MTKRTGGCNCGAVRFEIEGEPVRIGVCHCQTCRRATGSAFNFFAVWAADQVTITGDTRSWIATTDHRHFCPGCGSSLFSQVDGSGEIEISAGTLDEAPTSLQPAYELWLARREGWLTPVAGAAQHDGNWP